MIHVHVSAQCLFLCHHLPKTHVFLNVFYERADIPLQIPSLQSLSLFFFLDVDVSQAGQQLWGHRWHVAWCKIRTHQPARTESGQAGPQVLLNSSETSPPIMSSIVMVSYINHQSGMKPHYRTRLEGNLLR